MLNSSKIILSFQSIRPLSNSSFIMMILKWRIPLGLKLESTNLVIIEYIIKVIDLKFLLNYLGVFYFLLGNVCPVFRSSLQAIHLLAVAKTSDI